MGVAGTSFFTALAGFLTFEGLTEVVIPLEKLIPAAFIIAFIQGGLAFCREMTREAKLTGNPKPKNNIHRIGVKAHEILDCMVIW